MSGAMSTFSKTEEEMTIHSLLVLITSRGKREIVKLEPNALSFFDSLPMPKGGAEQGRALLEVPPSSHIDGVYRAGNPTVYR